MHFCHLHRKLSRFEFFLELLKSRNVKDNYLCILERPKIKFFEKMIARSSVFAYVLSSDFKIPNIIFVNQRLRPGLRITFMLCSSKIDQHQD